MSTEQNAVVVFLQVYSGRPDPSWTLDDSGVQDVVGRVRQAQSAPADGKPPEPVLGYRGFRVENRAGVPDLPAALTVWRGFVIGADRGGRTQTWSDVGDLEGWLLADARRRDHGELLEAAGAPTPQEPRPQSG
jgi:hypothetical protein